jgi:hypothetical protein
MATVRTPALEQFVARLPGELVLAQVLLTRTPSGFELRHVADRARPAEALRLLPLSELRKLAQVTASGAFRPLKAAPNLQSGWRAEARDAAELGTALNHLYPGALADWLAAQSDPPPVTHYREFTGRQTGMYRITQLLTDEQAAGVAAAGCHPDFCLKRRLWTVGTLKPEPSQTKSLIPCLEPCPVLLELARKAFRLEQEEKLPLALSPGEAASLVAALERALALPDPAAREADFNRPDNPRRLRLLLDKLTAVTQTAVKDSCA